MVGFSVIETRVRVVCVVVCKIKSVPKRNKKYFLTDIDGVYFFVNFEP